LLHDSPKSLQSTVTNTKDRKEEESHKKEFKHMIIRIINKMKKDMYKNLNEFKEDTHSRMKLGK
jgi:predicted nucleotide-binding protein (sugar kinase/HSP70/actin superfamily)